MKKVFLGVVIAASLGMMQVGYAASVCDIKSNLKEARESLLAMLDEADKAKQDELKKKIDETSNALETALKGVQEDAATAEDAKAKLKQLGETWGALRKTRDEEIIPAIAAGEKDKAKELATGVQAERVKTINGLMAELGGDKC